MIFVVYTSTRAGGDTGQRMGRPEYSYRFVLNEYIPMLERLGRVVEVEQPGEADTLYAEARHAGEHCIFLCFMPPNKTPLGLACPTIPVFAWEYPTLPCEPFCGKPRNDWTRMLAYMGAGLTHSDYTVERVRAVMGKDYPITSVPAPLWERASQVRSDVSLPVTLEFEGRVIDSRTADFSDYSRKHVQAVKPDVLPLPEEAAWGRQQLTLDGVLYTAIMNPHDGRKNWAEMLMGFCSAFRYEPNAVLVIKMAHYDPSEIIPEMLEVQHKMSPYQCRVVLVHSHLPKGDYETLLAASTYAVNTSHGEGQALPLMEYMSAGKPAVAPNHTAMESYVDDTCAFVVDSSLEPGTWPHDQRQALRTLRYRIHFHSLVHAYRCSYYVAMHEPETYARMSQAATQSLRRFCSMDILLPRLQSFIESRLDERLDVAATHQLQTREKSV